MDQKPAQPTPPRSRLQRWLLAIIGVVCVAVAAIGAVLPGLPTTIFLIAACWCFARSCPWFERVLIRENILFRPFLRYLEPGIQMPLRAKIITVFIIWGFSITSCVMMLEQIEEPRLVILTILGAAMIGSIVVMRLGAVQRTDATTTE